jgi:hypothetical protein
MFAAGSPKLMFYHGTTIRINEGKKINTTVFDQNEKQV